MTLIKINNNFRKGVRNIRKGPNSVFDWDGFLEEVFCRIFGTFLMNIFNDSFTAYRGLPLFLARCKLLTGLSLNPAGTSPLNLALRFDSPDWQLQWRDTGCTVLCRVYHKKIKQIKINIIDLYYVTLVTESMSHKCFFQVIFNHLNLEEPINKKTTTTFFFFI